MPADTDIADPAPLGLTGFALTTFIAGLIESGWLAGEGALDVLLPLAMAYGGTIQLFAGLLAFREGNTFALTAFNTYGAFWWWFALTEFFAANGMLNPSPTALGVTLVGFGVITTYLWISTFKLNWSLWLVFLTLAMTFFLLGLGDWFGIRLLTTLGGYAALLTALLAIYTAFAEVTNWSFAGTIIPLGGTPLGSTQQTSTAADE